MQNKFKSNMCALMLILVVACCASDESYVLASDDNSSVEEVKVPVSIHTSKSIAGAEFKFSYTDQLTFVSFEKSEDIMSASLTPVVEKDGSTHLGFYTANNDYKPQLGKIEVGYLIFEYAGDINQSVTIEEVKMVEVIDKDNTNSEVQNLNKTIGIPLSPLDSDLSIWVIASIVAVVLIAIVVIVARLRKKR